MKNRTRKEKISIDYLKVSYKYSKNVFNRIKEEENDEIWWGEENQKCFYTKRVTQQGNTEEQIVRIILRTDVQEYQELGTLTMHNTQKYKGRAFLSVENKALYSDLKFYLDYVEGVMSLEFNNITRVDIALTSNYNYIKALLKNIRDKNGTQMIYNGKKISNPKKTIQNFLEVYSRSREKKNEMPTLYFGQKKKTGLRVRIYDKARELREQSKEKLSYTKKWLGFDFEKLYRIEVELSNSQIRHICSQAKRIQPDWEHGETLIYLLLNTDLASFAFCYSINSVLYFRKNEESIELWNL